LQGLLLAQPGALLDAVCAMTTRPPIFPHTAVSSNVHDRRLLDAKRHRDRLEKGMKTQAGVVKLKQVAP